MSENGRVWNTITKKEILPMVRGKMKEPSYRLYKDSRGYCKSVRTWKRMVFPEIYCRSKEGFKDIPGYEGLYGISKDGRIWSYAKDDEKISRPTTTCPYLCIELFNGGKSKHHLVHRLVAETYIPNPNNLPEIDHINRDIMNNNVENLRWVDRVGNLENSSCGFVRNFRECTLFYHGKYVGTFHSISEAARYGSKNFGASRSGLNKYLKSKSCEIKSVTTSSMERRVG